MSTLDEIWMHKSDLDLQTALTQLDDYTEGARRAILDESQRRGLSIAGAEEHAALVSRIQETSDLPPDVVRQAVRHAKSPEQLSDLLERGHREQRTSQSSARQAIIAAAVAALLGIGYCSTRPSEEEARAVPPFKVVLEPTTLSGEFFGIVFGRHGSDNGFLLRDRQGTPFVSELPETIGIGGVTALVGHGMGYALNPRVKTTFAWMTEDGGDIDLYIDNATDTAIRVELDGRACPSLPARSHAKLRVKPGIHELTGAPTSTQRGGPVERVRHFLSSHPEGVSDIEANTGILADCYVWNVQGRNRYDLISARYKALHRE